MVIVTVLSHIAIMIVVSVTPIGTSFCIKVGARKKAPLFLSEKLL